jgi:hypothetical protein
MPFYVLRVVVVEEMEAMLGERERVSSSRRLEFLMDIIWLDFSYQPWAMWIDLWIFDQSNAWIWPSRPPLDRVC